MGTLLNADGKEIGSGSLAWMVKPDKTNLTKSMARFLVSSFGRHAGAQMKIRLEQDPTVKRVKRVR